ncbi:protein-L-isoaspartate O-methyltransferase [Novosphingobium bradum]|uniref:Protein-L-isoaspartate O-methyltransferase n=1 Tax=Novosphingobium bradum TaxID=1737444 RepID=A0ABV7IQY3_9SPHN
MTVLEDSPVTNAAAARRAMIDSQLRVSGVNDPAVLAAMDAVPREDFVPAAAKANAYIDRALPLGEGQALPAPLVHGRMLVEAAIAAGEQVLVVSPSGYLAALASRLGAEVASLAPADAATGKKGGLVALILVDGAIEQLPAGLAARLAEGGRIVTGLVEHGVTRLAVGRKVAGEVALLPLADMGIPVLAEFAAPRRWSF